MKKILVPTDFSENANKALEYAITIANKTGAIVSVLHAYQISSSTGSLISISRIVEEDREKELNELLRRVRPLLSGQASIEGFVRRGSSVDTICRLANKLTVDIVVMGTTGASGIKKVFLGSTAGSVMKNLELPVLAVPVDYGDFRLNNITIALDDKKVPETFVLHPAVELARDFECEVNLLHVVEDTEDDAGVDPSLQDYLKKFNIGYTYFKLEASDVEKGVLEFVERKSSDMICTIKHHRSWFQDIFHTSVSQQMAFDSKVPILVLHG